LVLIAVGALAFLTWTSGFQLTALRVPFFALIAGMVLVFILLGQEFHWFALRLLGVTDTRLAQRLGVQLGSLLTTAFLGYLALGPISVKTPEAVVVTFVRNAALIGSIYAPALLLWSLIGIVKKNAIMMIDYALVAEREHGRSPEQAILQACRLRFRPILMTTLTAILGAVPLAIGTGIGSELRQPLGISIIGGLVASQLLTLFTTPVVYLALDRLRREPCAAGGYLWAYPRGLVAARLFQSSERHLADDLLSRSTQTLSMSGLSAALWSEALDRLAM
jgi:hypothetical protein